MEKQVNRTLKYGNMPFGPYVMRTVIPEDIRKRLLKDGKKDLKSYHNQRLSRWYKNYFVSHWISSCLQDGYSFNACSEV